MHRFDAYTEQVLDDVISEIDGGKFSNFLLLPEKVSSVNYRKTWLFFYRK